MVNRFLSKIFWTLCSLKLAVCVIAGIAIACGAATVVESVYDTPTSQYYVYQSKAFYALLTLFGTNILCVALSRWPWKRRHTAFLTAHLGILTLLFGSFITYRHGLDASLRVAEGEVSNIVEVNTPVLTLAENGLMREVPVPWTPPIAKFSPIKIKAFGVTVSEFMTHADTKVSFVPAPASDPGAGFPAMKLEIRGGMMKIPQELWMWGGDPAWNASAMGPAMLRLANISGAEPNPTGGPDLLFSPRANGELAWSSSSPSGAKKSGRFKTESIKGQTLEPGWAMKFEVKILDWIPRAIHHVDYVPAKQQFGMEAPPSAIRVTAGDSSIWLGLGDRANLMNGSRKITLLYLPQRHVLPFGIRLDRFELSHYEGTRNPASYSSKVSVIDAPERSKQDVVISMNEPLTHQGITFYQSSYEDVSPRPTVSIFSVNRDPGRKLKYLGSLLIVLGSMLLFYGRLKKKSAGAPNTGPGGILT